MSRDSRQSRINLAVYRKAGTAQEYADPANQLTDGEQKILARLAAVIEGQAILDIGVGGGRTTPALLAISQDYTGIDYAEAMVEASRKRFPGRHFMTCDVRNLSPLGGRLFDFIWFSRNGINSLADDERSAALAQIYNKLKPGGWFLFSSHNKLPPSEKPWQLGLYVYQWNAGAGAFLGSACQLVRNHWNYLRYRPLAAEKAGHAIRIDSAHGFRGVHYYTEPEAQVQKLADIGFSSIEVMTGGGKQFPPGHDRLKSAIHLHFLARRAEF